MNIYDPISIALNIAPSKNNCNHYDDSIPEDAIFVLYGGNNLGEKRPGIGGVPKGTTPWNKGLTSTDPRVKKNSENMSKSKKESGFYNTSGKYLPKLLGDKNHMKKPEHKARMSALAKTRYRIYKEDGTWFWGYKS
jgi:hypothetical protein